MFTLMASKILLNSSLSSFFTVVRQSTDAVFLCTIYQKFDNNKWICQQWKYAASISSFSRMSMTKERCTNRSQSGFSFDNTVRDLHLPAQCRQPNHKLDWVHIMSDNHQLCLVLQEIASRSSQWTHVASSVYCTKQVKQSMQSAGIHTNGEEYKPVQ